jgi:nicotinamide-nucleotide amidase
VITELGLDRARVAGLLDVLRERGLTVACAESLTGGLLLAVLTAVPGASAVVRGGLVVYATDTKATLAGVPADLLRRHGPVHPEVAAALASGAADRCGAACGIGLTGVAGPDPQHGVEPGTVHIGVHAPFGVSVKTLQADGDRNAVRIAAVQGALAALRRLV